MEPTHLANELSTECVECLMETTERNYYLAREYFLSRKKVLTDAGGQDRVSGLSQEKLGL
jgi:hypothetical protein